MAKVIKTKENPLRGKVKNYDTMILLILVIMGIGLLAQLNFFIVLLMGVPFLNILMGKRKALRSGLRGEDDTQNLLASLPEDYYVLGDLQLQVGSERSQVDHVVVGPTGVFVIESKNHNGYIEGNENDHDVIQHKTGRKGGQYKKKMYNPVKQVGTHVYRVSEVFRREQIPVWVRGLVFFSNPAAKINIRTEKIPVFSMEDQGSSLLHFLRAKKQEKLLNDSEIQYIVQSILKYNQLSEA